MMARPALPRPALEVTILAGVGAAIAIYLTVTKLAGTGLALCVSGGSCDIVQASRYSVMLGVPTAAWGAGLYVLLAVLAARPFTTRRWLYSFGLAASGVAFSAYLTVIAVRVLGAMCGWCLTSAALMLAVLLALLRRRPPASARRPWLAPARLTVLGGLVAAATTAFALAVFIDVTPASPYQEALARHLADTGARMYGAYWCPHCQEQKTLFGAAAARLPYVECDARGAGARPDLCAIEGVRVYPTWTIGGVRREGTLSLDELARLAGFTPPRADR